MQRECSERLRYKHKLHFVLYFIVLHLIHAIYIVCCYLTNVLFLDFGKELVAYQTSEDVALSYFNEGPVGRDFNV